MILATKRWLRIDSPTVEIDVFSIIACHGLALTIVAKMLLLDI